VLSPRVFEVWELNKYIKRLLEDNRHLQCIWVKGEISNCRQPNSGHLYFSLIDSESSIKCVMYKDDLINLRFNPQNGQQVLILGSVSVYQRDGNYQIYVHDMEPLGLGSVQVFLEELKRKLLAEGLFDRENKKSIVKYPRKIGILTSLSGAAIQDILSIIKRRYPLAELYIYPAFVQGIQAVKTLCAGIEALNELKGIDVIILARGGGSSEDLSVFNDEQLARAIYKSKIPIVSAVGHETDFTIADFVADLRAPTPSAAAELVCPDREELLVYLKNLKKRLIDSFNSQIERRKEKLRVLAEHKFITITMGRIRGEQQRIDFLAYRLLQNYKNRIQQFRSELVLYEQLLAKTDPRSVLKKGIYCLVTDNNGYFLNSITQYKPGETFKIILKDGIIQGKVISITGEGKDE